MRLATILAFVMLAPWFARAQDAKAVAQEVLNKGAALFDSRDAAAMAETYSDDAKLTWIEKDGNTGKFKVEVKEGRSDIEKLYRDLFKDAKEKTTSRNTVEFAKFISPSLLLIEGEFEPKINEGKYSFVQERIKQGDKWVIMALRIYVVPQD